MSHTICDRCGIRYRDEHECAEDGDAMLQRIRDLEADVEVLKAQVASLQMAAPRGIPR
jgi:ribosomal protein L37E